MRSTGEVMGIAMSFGSAFAKAQLAADNALPLSGAVFITVNDPDKEAATQIARTFHEMGFDIFATPGTTKYLRSHGIQASEVYKVHEGRPHGIDLIVNGEIQLLINTPLGKHAQRDDYTLRQAAIANRVSYTTTLSAAEAAASAILSLRSRKPTIRALQEWHEDLRAWRAEGQNPNSAARVTPVSVAAGR
jgi:carbamoyl-phosphate synthase large subunit